MFSEKGDDFNIIRHVRSDLWKICTMMIGSGSDYIIIKKGFRSNSRSFGTHILAGSHLNSTLNQGFANSKIFLTSGLVIN